MLSCLKYISISIDLNDRRIGDIGEFFADGFRWMGNTGCGTKNNLKEFQDNWQKPFQVFTLIVKRQKNNR